MLHIGELCNMCCSNLALNACDTFERQSAELCSTLILHAGLAQSMLKKLFFAFLKYGYASLQATDNSAMAACNHVAPRGMENVLLGFAMQVM